MAFEGVRNLAIMFFKAINFDMRAEHHHYIFIIPKDRI